MSSDEVSAGGSGLVPTSRPLPLEIGVDGDRRQYRRRGIRDLPLIQPLLGEVLDMSAGGIGVRTWDAMPVDKQLFVSFGPPEGRVRVRSRIVWCRLRAAQQGVDWLPGYRAGIEFLEFPS